MARFKDIRQHNDTDDLNKIKAILNRCNCYFIGYQKDANGFAKYVMFNDKIIHTTLMLERKKFSYNNVMEKLKKHNII